ncbi:MAG: hypothetical protein WCF81_16225 [Roseiarcus sp.]
MAVIELTSTRLGRVNTIFFATTSSRQRFARTRGTTGKGKRNFRSFVAENVNPCNIMTNNRVKPRPDISSAERATFRRGGREKNTIEKIADLNRLTATASRSGFVASIARKTVSTWDG